MRYTKELHERVRQNLRMFDYPHFDDGDIEALLDEIDRLEAEAEKHRWIPVSERLPETHFEGTGEDTVKVSGNVLVDWLYNPMAENDDLCCRATSIAYTFNDKWMNICTGDEIEVNHEFAPTHWMPLPEPPKEDA